MLMPAVALYAIKLARWSELGNLRRSALATLGYVANWAAITSRRQYWDMFAAVQERDAHAALRVPLVGRRVGLGDCSLLSGRHHARLLRDRCAWCCDPDRRCARCAPRAAAAVCQRMGVARSRRRRRDRGRRIAWAWRTLDGQNPFLYHGGFWLTELAAVVLIACAVQGPSSYVARALSFAPLRFVGDISYGVYLWHWPIFVVLTPERTHVASPLLLVAIRFAVTFGIAAVSYRYLEQPIRRRGVARPAVALG
jgi:peptidoglycan/LPS O-acetylase OafA/YrhL